MRTLDERADAAMAYGEAVADAGAKQAGFAGGAAITGGLFLGAALVTLAGHVSAAWWATASSAVVSAGQLVRWRLAERRSRAATKEMWRRWSERDAELRAAVAAAEAKVQEAVAAMTDGAR